ncbi:MAG: hypothetical protein KAJ10_07790 [Thermodesulfovibrionia bacterium]|nr:hypothetical protein [Thermodesulfovibrionia bacterium]
MKKQILVLLLLTIIFVSPAWAGKADIVISPSLLQSDFDKLSREVGLALSYKPTAPAEPMGLLGFDIGIEATFTNIEQDSSYWKDVASDIPGTLPVPKLHVVKGLPWGIDIGAIYSEIPSSDISLLGAELKWAFVEGNVALPALAIRGTYTKVDGIDNLDFNTKGVDLSISKGFAMLTPYAGVGKVWIESEPDSTLAPLKKADLSETKVFVGLRISLGLINITAEAESAEVPSYTLKLSAGL